jgi:hypothetical protein
MHVNFQSAQEETTRPEQQRSQPECCPLCRGPLLPLQSAYRCARCHFSLCIGCYSGEETAD